MLQILNSESVWVYYNITGSFRQAGIKGDDKMQLMHTNNTVGVIALTVANDI